MAEAIPLKGVQCGFESRFRHMMDRETLLTILARMTLQYEYDTYNVSGDKLKEVWLNVTLTTDEYEEFKELFND